MSEGEQQPIESGLCHVEIPAPDLGRAQEFFTTVFGWEIRPMGERYLLFSDGGMGGGLDGDATVAADGGCVLVWAVKDIPAKLAEIEAAGGEIVQPRTELGEGHGAYAYFRDPNGNRLGIWSRT